MSESDAPDPKEPKEFLTNGGRRGPRSAEGKAISKFNATSHGIFSNVAVLKTESRADYESLLNGVRDACKPVGMLEEVLVDKLTTILWRYRRLIRAETGEVSENLSSIDRIDVRIRERDRLDLEYLQRRRSAQGVIGMTYDPEILNVCLRALSNLHDRIKTHGFRPTADEAVLGEIYGRRENLLGEIRRGTDNKGDLFDTYEVWRLTSEASEDDRQKYRYASPEKCREKVLDAIETEITKLKEMLDALNTSRTEQSELEQLRRSLPEADRMERLLRYEATLERAFDRALVQLERLQRMRLGQPVIPPIKVDING